MSFSISIINTSSLLQGIDLKQKSSIPLILIINENLSNYTLLSQGMCQVIMVTLNLCMLKFIIASFFYQI